MVATYSEWCKENHCDHGHCPEDCEHPQPFIHDGQLYCGEHWVLGGVLCEMIPCTPENCG